MNSSPADPQRPARVDAERFACHAARLIADSNCEDVVVMDLRGLSSVTDFFVIATGTSDRQLRSVAEQVEELAKVEAHGKARVHGVESARWVVLDFIDVIVHLFDPELRPYYDLESLWADAPRTSWQTKTRPGQFSHIATHRGGASA